MPLTLHGALKAPDRSGPRELLPATIESKCAGEQSVWDLLDVVVTHSPFGRKGEWKDALVEQGDETLVAVRAQAKHRKLWYEKGIPSLIQRL